MQTGSAVSSMASWWQQKTPCQSVFLSKSYTWPYTITIQYNLSAVNFNIKIPSPNKWYNSLFQIPMYSINCSCITKVYNVQYTYVMYIYMLRKFDRFSYIRTAIPLKIRLTTLLRPKYSYKISYKVPIQLVSYITTIYTSNHKLPRAVQKYTGRV